MVISLMISAPSGNYSYSLLLKMVICSCLHVKNSAFRSYVSLPEANPHVLLFKPMRAL